MLPPSGTRSPGSGRYDLVPGFGSHLGYHHRSRLFLPLGSPFFSCSILLTLPRAGHLAIDSQKHINPQYASDPCFAFISDLEVIRGKIYRPKPQAAMEHVSVR